MYSYQSRIIDQSLDLITVHQLVYEGNDKEEVFLSAADLFLSLALGTTLAINTCMIVYSYGSVT